MVGKFTLYFPYILLIAALVLTGIERFFNKIFKSNIQVSFPHFLTKEQSNGVQRQILTHICTLMPFNASQKPQPSDCAILCQGSTSEKDAGLGLGLTNRGRPSLIYLDICITFIKRGINAHIYILFMVTVLQKKKSCAQ